MRYTLGLILLVLMVCLTGCDGNKTIAPKEVPPQLPPGTRPGAGEAPGAKAGSKAPTMDAK